MSKRTQITDILIELQSAQTAARRISELLLHDSDLVEEESHAQRYLIGAHGLSRCLEAQLERVEDVAVKVACEEQQDERRPKAV